jgi:hypothetical protein
MRAPTSSMGNPESGLTNPRLAGRASPAALFSDTEASEDLAE